jgi:hypothetical protein
MTSQGLTASVFPRTGAVLMLDAGTKGRLLLTGEHATLGGGGFALRLSATQESPSPPC